MTQHRPRPTTALTGTAFALAGLAAGISHAPAVLAAGVVSPTQQVAVADGTGEQFGISSSGSGTGQLVSADGRLVVFSTSAPLVAWDDNQTEDIYLRDTVAGTTTLVSQRDGVPGNDISSNPTISADGSRVAFITWATNLTGTEDTNGTALDAVVADTTTGDIELVSQSTAGFQREQNTVDAVISGDGRFVAFQSFGSFSIKDDDRKEDVFLRNLDSGRTTQVSLLPGSDRDVRGSVLVGGISDDGSKVTFGDANHLWVRDTAVRETTRFWQEPDSPPCQPNPTGSAGRPAISGNGRYAAFASCATDLPRENGKATDVYRIDLVTGKIRRAHPAGQDNSFLPSLSRSGRFVGFASDAHDLVAGDDEGKADTFLADLRERTVVRVSQAVDGTGGNRHSGTSHVVVNSSGTALAYQSYADNLVPGDVQDEREILLWHR
jgi:Tol biopolymer transport system component